MILSCFSLARVIITPHQHMMSRIGGFLNVDVKRRRNFSSDFMELPFTPFLLRLGGKLFCWRKEKRRTSHSILILRFRC